MKYIDEYRNKELIARQSDVISRLACSVEFSVMEVCGTHTQSFIRFGLNKLLPGNVKLISGPGCPVCVSTQEFIDRAIAYSKEKNVKLLTFGDMMRVPGTNSSLQKERAAGASVAVIYSALDALSIAKNNPSKKVIFLAVGFDDNRSHYRDNYP